MLSSASTFVISIILLLCAPCLSFPIGVDIIHKRGGVPALQGSAVVFGDGTYPRTNKMSDGSIIGAYTAFSGGYNVIKTVRSIDGGKS